MKLGITLKQQAYTPEAFAYKKYLEAKGHVVQLDFPERLSSCNDINIYFMGLRPFWGVKKGSFLEVHEYQSLSVPRYAKFKDLIKRVVSVTPHGRIFLNTNVQHGMHFTDNVPFIKRDMGVDDLFFNCPKGKVPNYDIVYSGSIDSRVGLIETLLSLAEKGYKILVIGELSLDNQKTLESTKYVECIGRVPYESLPALYAQARFGLNFTPDIYPFNIQTSTKTLEYLASGLHLISNRYHWIENFCNLLNYNPLWFSEKLDLRLSELSELPDMSAFNWQCILEQSNFEDFLLNILEINRYK